MSRNVASVAAKALPERHSVGPKHRSSAKLADDAAFPVASTVHDLQDLLARSLETPAGRKWSGRATVGFVLLVCGGFWAGVYLVARLLMG